MKSIFRMGIPVTGKNYFPSNIQGLPTWYEIRVSGDGYICRSGRVDLMVAMNAQTYREGPARRRARRLPDLRLDLAARASCSRATDITILGVPLARMCNEHFTRARARILMKNIAYVGVLAALLDIDLEVIAQLLQETLRRTSRT